jgi:transcriptional regulator with XRE-family HTH domain
MKKTLSQFGQMLRDIRTEKKLSLREICKEVNYDPSNWSKIERGRISPPSDEKTLNLWAKKLGIIKSSNQYRQFIDLAKLSQGIIPNDILLNKNSIECLPAFFRTLRNKKPTKNEIDNLINLIKSS